VGEGIGFGLGVGAGVGVGVGLGVGVGFAVGVGFGVGTDPGLAADAETGLGVGSGVWAGVVTSSSVGLGVVVSMDIEGLGVSAETEDDAADLSMVFVFEGWSVGAMSNAPKKCTNEKNTFHPSTHTSVRKELLQRINWNCKYNKNQGDNAGNRREKHNCR